jgi:uncharacterized protein (TIGR03067 family)
MKLAPLIVLLMVTVTVRATAEDPKPGTVADARKAAREDLKKLQGAWLRIAMEHEGDDVPVDPDRESVAIYEDDTLTLVNGGEAYRRGIVTLDATKNPRAMNTWDLNGPFADATLAGIYELKDDTLRVCFARPGNARPTEFTSKRGSGFLVCVYKRKKP